MPGYPISSRSSSPTFTSTLPPPPSSPLPTHNHQIPLQTTLVPAPTNCTDAAKAKNIHLMYEELPETAPAPPQAPASSAYTCLDAEYVRVFTTKGKEENHIGWARPEAYDNHPWYSSALRLRVPRTYTFFEQFGVQQPANVSVAVRELRESAHRMEHCIGAMLGELFPAQVCG